MQKDCFWDFKDCKNPEKKGKTAVLKNYPEKWERKPIKKVKAKNNISVIGK